MNPLISVIVPIYNVEKYLQECIDSIINQTYKNLEIILVDDGSPDSCGNICDNYARKDNRVVVIHKENGGLSSARNAGLEVCSGKYISFIDSDDYVSEFFIEILYKAAELYNCDVVTGTGAKEFYVGATERPTLAQSIDDCSMIEIEPKRALELMLYRKLPNGAPFRLYKKYIFDEIRFPVGYVYEDIATIHKTFIKAKKMSVVNADIYAYRVRKDSIIRMQFDKRKMVVIPITQQLHEEVCVAYPELETAVSNRCFAQCYHVLLQIPLNNKEYMKRIWKELKKYRGAVIKDHNLLARKKDKVGAIISLMGMDISYFIGTKYIQKRDAWR